MRNPFTKRHIKYWENRKIDWREAYFTPDHPHRELIIRALKRIQFGSVIEAGCASGANLYKIRQNFPSAQIGGIDISKDAIDMAFEILGECAVLEVSSVTSMFLSDNSVDVILTDACLIYIDPFNINKAIKEIKRVARNNILLIEFHSTNWFKRQALRLFAGYNAYNWPKLLEKHGFSQIEMVKLKQEDWPGGEPWKTFGHIISAKLL